MDPIRLDIELWNPRESLQGLVHGMDDLDPDQQVRLFNFVMATKGASHSYEFKRLLSGGERELDHKPMRGLASHFKLLAEPQQKILTDLLKDWKLEYDPATMAGNDERTMSDEEYWAPPSDRWQEARAKRDARNKLESDFADKSKILAEVALGGWATVDKFFGVPAAST